MITKEIAVLIIFIIGLPSLIGTVAFSFNASHNTSAENTEQATKLIEEAAVPWWVGPFQWLVGLPVIGGILGLGFIFLLKWVGEIR